jgi:acyl dehydratase
LFDTSASEILNLHQYAREIVKKPIVITETLAVAKAIANLEYLNIKHINPVFLNDTIYVYSKILDKIESKTKSDRGIIHVESIVLNQNNEVVLTFERKVLVKKC